jgi:glycosyltransferase involved in cell wall biosynthesis
MGEPLRLLCLRDTSYVCGPGNTILNTFRTLDRKRFSLQVGVPVSGAEPNGFIERATELGLQVLPIPVGPFEPAGVLRLVRLLREHRIDVVQSHDFLTRRLAVPAAALARVAHVTSVHGWITNTRKEAFAKRIDQWLIGHAVRVIAVSSLLRDQLVEAGVQPARVRLVPNAVLLDDYPSGVRSPAAARLHLGLPADGKVVTIVGRLSPEKEHAVFLEMCGRIAAKRPSTLFLIVGHGPLRAALEINSRSRGLAERVVFLGLRTDMHYIYTASDVVILCSSTEGLPNVILEAFAHRRPVVATRVGGVPDLVSDGHTGFLVGRGDVAALTRATMRLLDDPGLAEACGEAGRRLVEKRFDFRARTACVEALYEEVARAEKGGTTSASRRLGSRSGR